MRLSIPCTTLDGDSVYAEVRANSSSDYEIIGILDSDGLEEVTLPPADVDSINRQVCDKIPEEMADSRAYNRELMRD